MAEQTTISKNNYSTVFLKKMLVSILLQVAHQLFNLEVGSESLNDDRLHVQIWQPLWTAERRCNEKQKHAPKTKLHLYSIQGKIHNVLLDDTGRPFTTFVIVVDRMKII